MLSTACRGAPDSTGCRCSEATWPSGVGDGAAFILSATNMAARLHRCKSLRWACYERDASVVVGRCERDVPVYLRYISGKPPVYLRYISPFSAVQAGPGGPVSC